MIPGRSDSVAERALKPGKHELEFRARDRAGNEVRSARFALSVAGPIGITQAVCVPNPVQRPPTRLRYLLTRAAWLPALFALVSMLLFEMGLRFYTRLLVMTTGSDGRSQVEPET